MIGMRYELLMGVAITDQEMHAAYGTEIRPLPAMVGGRFFENSQYLAVRVRLLLPAVEKITDIAEYEGQPLKGVQ